MSLFDWFRPRTELYVEPGLLKRLIEIEARQVTLERAVKTIDAEWSEWFDKFRHMYARLAKRIKDASQAEGDGTGSQESHQDAPGRAIEPIPSPGYHPSPRASVAGRRNY